MTLITDIAHWLISHGYGTALGTDIFSYHLDPSPDNLILIIPRSGRPPDQEMGGTAVDYPSVDIHVRNTSKAQAEAKAEAIRQTLDGETINGATFWDSRSFTQFIEKDSSNRYRFMISFDVTKERI